MILLPLPSYVALTNKGLFEPRLETLSKTKASIRLLDTADDKPLEYGVNSHFLTCYFC